MGKKQNFSNVAPGATTPTPGQYGPAANGSQPPAPGGGWSSWVKDRRVQWAFGALVAVLVVILIVGLVGGGGSGGDADKQSVSAPHGPAEVTDGVPSGYTRDQSGAATAAVNWLQAIAQARDGKIDAEKVRSTLVVSNPGENVAGSLERATGREDLGDSTSTIPVSVTPVTITPNSASISVWSVTGGQSRINENDATMPVYTWDTTTVHLVWSGDDWQVRETEYRRGPQPNEVGTQSADAAKPVSGYYSFFVN